MAELLRYRAWPATGVDRDRAVLIVSMKKGRVFAMSASEARDLANELVKSADRHDARRRAFQ